MSRFTLNLLAVSCLVATCMPWLAAADDLLVEAVPGYPVPPFVGVAPTRRAPPPLPPVPVSPVAAAPAVPVARVVPLVVAAPVGPGGVQVGPPALITPVYIDPRTGRCLPGFSRDHLGACIRHDEPRVVCQEPLAQPVPGVCGIALPNPAPYGLGAMLRRDY